MEGNLEHCDGGLARGMVPGYRVRVRVRGRKIMTVIDTVAIQRCFPVQQVISGTS